MTLLSYPDEQKNSEQVAIYKEKVQGSWPKVLAYPFCISFRLVLCQYFSITSGSE